MHKKVRVGVVGLGFWSTLTHLPIYETIPNIDVVAVSDVVEEKLQRVAHRFGIKKTYTDFAQMLESEDLDIVSICTPPSTHASLTVTAAEHGCNIFVEKPMAISLEECNQMIAAAEKNRVKLAINANYRWLPEYVCAKEYLENKIIGDPYFIEIEEFCWNLPDATRAMRKQSSLLILEMAVHYIDLIRWLADSKANFVHAISKKVPIMDVRGESFCIVTIQFENEITGIVEDSWCAKGINERIRRARIDGTKGSILIGWERPIQVYSESELGGRWIVPEVRDEVFRAKLIKATGEAIKALIKSMDENSEPPTSGRDFRKTMEIVFAAYESAEKHSVIKLEHKDGQ